MKVNSKRRVRLRLAVREVGDAFLSLEKVEEAIRRSIPASSDGAATKERHVGQVSDEVLEGQALARATRRLDGKSHRPPVHELTQDIPHDEQARMLKDHLERRTFIGIRPLAVECVKT